MKKKNVLLVNDTGLICHHGCNLLMNTIHNLLKKNNLIIKKRIFYEENYLEHLSSKIKNYDIILINGEGTIHGKSNADSNKVFEIIEFIKIIKKNYDIPVVIFNSTISSLKKKQIEILKLVDRIYVREKYSYNYLKKENIKSKILPDLLSLLTIKYSKNVGNILVTDSSIPKTTKKLLIFSISKNYSYIPILYNNYLRYLRFFIYKFVLKFKIDYLINFYLYLKNLYLKNFLKEISKSKLILTGRFHGIFICLALMKPFYTFQSDTYKIRGLINMIGLKSRMIDVNKIGNLKFSKFSKSEILKIKNFKISSKKKFNRFIQELHYLNSRK